MATSPCLSPVRRSARLRTCCRPCRSAPASFRVCSERTGWPFTIVWRARASSALPLFESMIGRTGLMRRLSLLVCTFGCIGFFPIAPGTVGSAAGILIYAGCRMLGLTHFEAPLIAALFALGVVFGKTAEDVLGGVDPGPVVIDEVMGQLITLCWIPVNWGG